MSQKKLKTRAELEREILELKAQLPSTYHSSARALFQAAKDKCTGSGVIITIEKLGGGKIVRPTMIKNGLRSKTIESLIEDLRDSFNEAMDFKP